MSRSAMGLLVSDLEVPIVLAPLGGGPSTVELALAVSEADGLGFLASGYRTTDDVRRQIQALRDATSRPFGVNVFVPSNAEVDEQALSAYVQRLGSFPGRSRGQGHRYGLRRGPRLRRSRTRATHPVAS
jgi:NAD(P)H-dependent flavin oxidoreductase YrpB (nitropropane dioxygenase family)